MISVSGHFIPFIFKICQINVGIIWSVDFTTFSIPNFSADFFSLAQLCAAANDGSRLYIHKTTTSKKKDETGKKTDTPKYTLCPWRLHPPAVFSWNPIALRKPANLEKKSTNQIYLRKNEHGSMAAERGAKWGEVKRNFFPPSRNSIPLVKKKKWRVFSLQTWGRKAASMVWVCNATPVNFKCG